MTHTAQRGRVCPFPERATWAVYKVGPAWRVDRPARAWACHPVDAWSGDFATHAEALAWATTPQLRADWIDRPERSGTAPTDADRYALIEGITAPCIAATARARVLHQFFGGT